MPVGLGFYAVAQIVRDAREHGVEVRPICINASRWDCTLEPTAREGQFADLSGELASVGERNIGLIVHWRRGFTKYENPPLILNLSVKSRVPAVNRLRL